MMLMTKEAFEELLTNVERASLDKEMIRSFQLDASIVKSILTNYKHRLVEEMKNNHPDIYHAFQNNNQAFKIANSSTIFEQSLSEDKLSKIGRLSLNHQTNRIIYNLDLLIKTPDRYTTLFDLYKRTKTTSFGGTVNQKSLDKLETTLITQLQQVHHYYQEICDGMTEIDHLRNPKTMKKAHDKPGHKPLPPPPNITKTAQKIFNKMYDKNALKQKISVDNKTTNDFSKISLTDLHGVVQLYKESIDKEMKEKHPKIYALYQNNNYNFSTTKGAGNIFHQILFNTRLNQNKLPSEAESSLNKDIKKILSGITSMAKMSDQFSRIYDMYERIKNVHGVAKGDALNELEKKLSATLEQSKKLTSNILEGLNQIDLLDKQYQEQPASLLDPEKVRYLVTSKSIATTPNPQDKKYNKHKTTPSIPQNTAFKNKTFKKTLTKMKKDTVNTSSKKPSLKS